MKIACLWYFEAIWGRVRRDFWRVMGLVIAASVMLAVDSPLAVAIGRPEMAPWFMFAGLALYGAALSHVLRRVLFPYLDLRKVAADAKDSPGSGLVFLGVCIVLAVALSMMTSLVRG